MIRVLLAFRGWYAGLVLLTALGLCVTPAAMAARKEGERRTPKQSADVHGPDESAVEAKPTETVTPQVDDEDEIAQPEILVLGENNERFWVAFADKKISIWANRMPADKLLQELAAYGGPTFTCFEKLTRPVTLSMVHVRMEDVLRKMLDGYNFAYYYEDGRLAHVRVLNFVPGRQYKVADPVTTRSDWTGEVLAATKR